ncbi:MAG: hypothetical protein BWK80_22645 [Desulfobacteraceae bacterium IS3]|nr:MAG: hypothetical protein BWK80_22645 [Desulfobacteraceae bacterium IS3]
MRDWKIGKQISGNLRKKTEKIHRIIRICPGNRFKDKNETVSAFASKQKTVISGTKLLSG